MDEPTFPDLRAYLGQLRRDGDLAVVEAPVDARLEAAEIHRRVIAAGGPALLFTNVRGAEIPLATNLFGTARRAEMAFGKRPFRVHVDPTRDGAEVAFGVIDRVRDEMLNRVGLSDLLAPRING